MNSHVVLFNKGILPTYLVVHFKPNETEWDVKEIEMYADQHLRTLLCDAINLDQLPAATQASLIAALNESRPRALLNRAAAGSSIRSAGMLSAASPTRAESKSRPQ
ncbi:MAG TPA: hypothetical protein VGO37_01750 [Steroidobacteraceae bacterium]|jgi:hypothetical protein|nr:hypothetical protein [Steroidobacteraceae bacterium]